jgi:branched-chain amino acid transport system permease protein
MAILVQAVVSAILLAAVYYVISLGLSIIFGVLDIVNFAHGEFVILGAYVTFWLWKLTGLSPFLLILPAMVLVALFGGIVYAGYLQRTVDETLVRMFGLVGIGSVIQSGLLIGAGANFQAIETSAGKVTILGLVVPQSQLISFVVELALGAATLLLLNYTMMGKAIRAIVDDRHAVQLCGINDRRLSLIAFMAGSALAGAGGGVIATYLTFGSSSGLAFGVVGFTVVVLGGLGDLVSAAFASVLVALVFSLVSVYLSPDLVNLAMFVLVLVVLLVRPTGLLGHGRI